jgi:hypothetical protein
MIRPTIVTLAAASVLAACVRYGGVAHVKAGSTAARAKVGVRCGEFTIDSTQTEAALYQRIAECRQLRRCE